MIDKERKQVLEAFYKNFFSWKADNIGQWILTGILEAVCVILMCIPYQNIFKEGIWGIPVLLAVVGAMCYINPYIYYLNEGKMERIYDVIKYLPVSLCELRSFRLKKVILFCLKMFLIFLAGQMIFSLLCFHEIGWGNFLYPLAMGLVFPMVLNSIYLWTMK